MHTADHATAVELKDDFRSVYALSWELQESEREKARLCPWTWCRSWAAGISVAGRAALVHAAAAGSMRVRSSRIGAMVSRVM